MTKSFFSVFLLSLMLVIALIAFGFRALKGPAIDAGVNAVLTEHLNAERGPAVPRASDRRNAVPPNIIRIMADDMGYSDLSCMGSEIPTPNLDRLAGKGILMTQFYNAGRCCPTRASLLTGLYQHQAGVGDMDSDYGISAYQGQLKTNT
ncbi:sulfatase-like hydrolase/transferase, partial [Persicitalea sp.]|uniref:sulfatase-like hydrolase/transferase n=1 Tax=Persicitalea sp. TaxID=3100273 RepID=UPI003592ED28